MNDEGFEVFTIELTDPPQERFTEVGRFFKDSIANILKGYRFNIPNFFRNYLDTFSSMIEFF
jgi:hypothetical protein